MCAQDVMHGSIWGCVCAEARGSIWGSVYAEEALTQGSTWGCVCAEDMTEGLSGLCSGDLIHL